MTTIPDGAAHDAIAAARLACQADADVSTWPYQHMR